MQRIGEAPHEFLLVADRLAEPCRTESLGRLDLPVAGPVQPEPDHPLAAGRAVAVTVEIFVGPLVSLQRETLSRPVAVIDGDDQELLSPRFTVLGRIRGPDDQFVHTLFQEVDVRDLHRGPFHLGPIDFAPCAMQWHILNSTHPLVSVQREPDPLPTIPRELPVRCPQCPEDLQLGRSQVIDGIQRDGLQDPCGLVGVRLGMERHLAAASTGIEADDDRLVGPVRGLRFRHGVRGLAGRRECQADGNRQRQNRQQASEFHDE